MTAVLHFGFFEHYEGEPTLLIWGEREGLARFREIIAEIAEGKSNEVRLHELPWVSSAKGEKAFLGIYDPKAHGPRGLQKLWSLYWYFPKSRIVRAAGEPITVYYRASRDDFETMAQLIAAFSDPPHDGGHQYVDTDAVPPFQIIVLNSNRPSRLLVGDSEFDH